MTAPMALAFEERGSGPVLVLVHGFPLDRTMWTAQLAGLAGVRRVVAVDLRGHGLSHVDDAGGFSMDLFADDVAATLDEIGAEQADICGLSMGGYVAFAFARRHPARMRSLALVCTKAEADSEDAKAGREAAAERVLGGGMERLVEGLMPKMFGEDAPDSVREHVRTMFLRVPPEVAAADLLAMRDRPDATGDLAAIGVPVLWIAGEADQIMPFDAAKAAAEAIPGARFVSVPGAGHLAPMERPDEVNEALRSFLAR